MKKRTILMYGRTRSGKTSQIADLALEIYKTTGKKTLVYSIDKGGIGPLNPGIELGYIVLVLQNDTNPWLFLNKVSNGQVRNAQGKWEKTNLDEFGLIAVESFTGFGDAVMMNMAAQSAEGVNIGGQANVSFTINSDGENLKIGGNNMAHYNVAQTRLLDEFLRSQKLPVPLVLWTASASKEEDGNFGGKVIGPAGPGKALTAELPRHCDLCFRIDCTPAKGTEKERHIIYLGNSVDMNAGMATSLGNTRIPMGVELKGDDGKVATTVEPASLSKVLAMIERAEKEAVEIARKAIESAKKASGK